MACVRCGGTGGITAYTHVQGGVCFRCQGSGTDPKEFSLFPAKEIYREKQIGDSRVVLAVRKDLAGRFLGYTVFCKGQRYCGTFTRLKEADAAFTELVAQEKAGRAAATGSRREMGKDGRLI